MSKRLTHGKTKKTKKNKGILNINKIVNKLEKKVKGRKRTKRKQNLKKYLRL